MHLLKEAYLVEEWAVMSNKEKHNMIWSLKDDILCIKFVIINLYFQTLTDSSLCFLHLLVYTGTLWSTLMARVKMSMVFETREIKTQKHSVLHVMC